MIHVNVLPLILTFIPDMSFCFFFLFWFWELEQILDKEISLGWLIVLYINSCWILYRAPTEDWIHYSVVIVSHIEATVKNSVLNYQIIILTGGEKIKFVHAENSQYFIIIPNFTKFSGHWKIPKYFLCKLGLT